MFVVAGFGFSFYLYDLDCELCVTWRGRVNRQTKIYKFRSLEYWCTGKDLHFVDDVRRRTT